MDCPTCFRKLIVPQAPAPGSKNFVLTAAEVPTRNIPLPGSSRPSATPAVAAPQKFPMVALVVGALLIGVAATAAIFLITKRGKSGPADLDDEKSRSAIVTTNARPMLVLPPPAPEATNWTLNLAEAKIPDEPASGAVHGFGFKLERATIQGGKLDLRQGPKWPPDVGVSIHLFADRAQDLAGKTVVLESGRTNAPRVLLRWKDGAEKPVTKEFKQGYAARVEFGKVIGNRLEGKIYLATPDETRSYAAGTFNAEIRKSNPPK